MDNFKWPSSGRLANNNRVFVQNLRQRPLEKLIRKRKSHRESVSKNGRRKSILVSKSARFNWYLFILLFFVKRVASLQRFVYGPNTQESGIPKTFLFLGRRVVQKRANAQGYGLHNKEEGIQNINYIGSC